MKKMDLKSQLRSLVLGADTQVPLLNGEHVTAINFDNAATTPPFFSVMKEINNFAPWYSSIHRGTGYKSVLSSNLFEEGREAIKEFVKAGSQDVVIYTKNTTEAINILAYSLWQINKEQVILSTEMEHLANDLPWRDKFTVDYIAVDDYGQLSLTDLEDKLLRYKGRVKLVAVAGASNVTGYINPIYKIARLAHKHGAKILVDGAQLVPHAPVDMKPYDSPEHLDYLAFSGHKMYAPFDIGALIGPKETFVQGKPIYQGGGDVRLVSHQFIEWSDPPAKNEAGTPNVMGVVALMTAMKTINSIGMDVIADYEKYLITYAIEGLKTIPGLELYCCHRKNEERVSLISFNVEGLHNDLLAQILSDEAGISVRNGLFCAHPYVEKLLKLSAEDLDYCHHHHEVSFPGLVRISFGLYNNLQEIDIFLETLKNISKNKNYYKKNYKERGPR